VEAAGNAPVDPWRRAAVTFGLITLALLAVLAVTGAFLSTAYRPTVSQALRGIPGVDDDQQAARVIHRVVGLLTLLPAAGLLVAATVLSIRRWGRSGGLAGLAAIPVVLVLAAAALSGFLLPWDQLALFTVEVPRHVEGVWTAAFDDKVRYVLIGRTEIDQETYALWVILHVVVFPLLLVALAVFLGRSLRAARPSPDRDEASRATASAGWTQGTPSTPDP
jgi:quinol-cytochrome oxidoreductase complex cytochrome b subunit